ncbi:MAG TPA: L-histidine N(alpha)-methyltransferase [Candidatus Pristimantibacillus sp.]|nr:L-histidine N(alpha)-methyltransferase [Candidatus Pristimantibacillus sp.]
MKYFKNTELAKLYNISEKSVRNWIEAAQAGKLDLQLHQEKDKYYIANTSQNNFLIEQQVKKGKKYKNTRGFKTLTPTDVFYKTYDRKQILDIVANLTIHKEIPLQYGYLDGGADSWNQYANRLVIEQTPNILTKTMHLLNLNADYIDQILGTRRKVNVVDLGPGNGLPVKSVLERLVKEDRLNRYIAIDISRDMLTILERNIKEWFGDKVKLECHVRNFTEERFNDLFTEDYTGESDDAPANLVFLFGGTLSNIKVPDYLLRTINNSLGANDVFFYSGYLDTDYTRRYFDLSGASHDQKDPQQSGLIPSFLQIDESICKFEQLFSEEKRARFKQMVPIVDLCIDFEIDGKKWPVELRKNEPILLWRHRHYTTADLVELFNKNDFDLLQVTKSEDQNYVLVMSKIKTGLNS